MNVEAGKDKKEGKMSKEGVMRILEEIGNNQVERKRISKMRVGFQDS